VQDLKYYFKKAEREKWAIGQFNFYSLEILEAIIKAARDLKSPVILGTSERQSKITGLKKAVALVKRYRKKLKHPIFLHLDHGRSFNYIRKAIDAGYDSVHFDGSGLPLKDNIKITKKVVNYARNRKIPVEGEFDAIGAVDSKKGVFTKPSVALRFLKETRVDSLAVTIGNLHGITASGVNPKLNLKRLKEIKKVTGRTPLVLHGGSGTRQGDIKEAIRLGVVKINIGTEIKRAQTPQRVKKVVEDKIKLFKSVNKV
jgi:ketose-bisphosphate aldolase